MQPVYLEVAGQDKEIKMNNANIIIAPPSYHPIHRQNGTSKQPRFSEVNPRNFFNSLLRFAKSNIQKEPEYGSVERDLWLRTIWPQEPYLAGVINSVTNIDKNRGWTITGGRNQVNRFVDILHNRFYYAPDLSGWRMSFGGSSLSYWTSDMGSVTEIGRLDSMQGPLDSMYFVDPARCRLTGSFEMPLEYKPDKGNKQQWRRDDYFRVVSLPNTDESLYGLGLCALSRCIELVKIMIGIYQYDNEMLLNQAPRGLLLLKGITEEQWENAMTARKARLEGDEQKYYGAIHVLAALDPGVELEAQMIALSQLPAEFNQKTFTDLLLYGYALCFGYDPREFWPVSSGSLGTATETEAQHRKGGAKGGLDFVLSFAEALNTELPDTILFEFEERDLDGELHQAEVEQAQANVVMTMYEKGTGIISLEQAQVLAAERGLIDPDWTMEQEDTVATDEGEERSLHPRIERAMYQYPNEPIIKYTFKNNQYYTRTIHNPHQRIFPVLRQAPSYQQQLTTLAEQANNGDIDQAAFTDRLDSLTIAALVDALVRGYDDDNEARGLLRDAAQLILENDSQEAMQAGLETLTDDVILSEAFSQFELDRLNERLDLASQSTLPRDIFIAGATVNVAHHVGMWNNAVENMHNVGKIAGHTEALYRWEVGNTEKSCSDCAGNDGQIMTGAEWAGGLLPKDPGLECGGFNCQCELVEA